MRLDADKLKEEAEAHGARMKSPLWSDDDGRRGDDWTAKLTGQADPPSRRSTEAASSQRVEQPQPTQWESFLSESDETAAVPPRPREASPDITAQAILPRLDALDQAVEKLTATMSRRPLGGGDASGWIATAAGNPHTYDSPDAQRTGVCVRVLPTTYAQLQQIQRKLGLRTTAGAWEFLLRLGFAAAERLPA